MNCGILVGDLIGCELFINCYYSVFYVIGIFKVVVCVIYYGCLFSDFWDISF